MPTLADGLAAWFHGATPQELGVPATMAEFVERAGGKAAAARELGINPRTGRDYTVRTIERYLHQRGDINPRTGREYEVRAMSGAVRQAFDDARESMVGRMSVDVNNVEIIVSEDRSIRRHIGGVALDADTMARVAAALRRGDGEDAAAEFAGAWFDSYGIPGGDYDRHIGDVGALTITRA